jgi:hypothetical protein
MIRFVTNYNHHVTNIFLTHSYENNHVRAKSCHYVNHVSYFDDLTSLENEVNNNENQAFWRHIS